MCCLAVLNSVAEVTPRFLAPFVGFEQTAREAPESHANSAVIFPCNVSMPKIVYHSARRFPMNETKNQQNKQENQHGHQNQEPKKEQNPNDPQNRQTERNQRDQGHEQGQREREKQPAR